MGLRVRTSAIRVAQARGTTFTIIFAIHTAVHRSPVVHRLGSMAVCAASMRVQLRTRAQHRLTQVRRRSAGAPRAPLLFFRPPSPRTSGRLQDMTRHVAWVVAGVAHMRRYEGRHLPHTRTGVREPSEEVAGVHHRCEVRRRGRHDGARVYVRRRTTRGWYTWETASS